MVSWDMIRDQAEMEAEGVFVSVCGGVHVSHCE